jgi:hypothetical protein
MSSSKRNSGSPAAVYAKASEIGVSLAPTNQSPYGTRKK